MTALKYSSLILSYEVSDSTLSKLKKAFPIIFYHPDGKVSKESMQKGEVWFSRHNGPENVKLEEVPNLKLVQLTSAGANNVIKSPFFQDPKAWEQIAVSTTSGIHVYSIPQYIIGQCVCLYMNIHNQNYILRSEHKWPERERLRWNPLGPKNNLGFFSLRGKTAGMLGYGHIARETARVLKTMGVEIIAANTSGKGSVDEGYIVPGTGDKEGSIPSNYYSTKDEKSFNEFLSRTEILVASLPSTPQTQYLLKEKHLRALPQNAIFINVGRGDLVSSDDLLSVINSDPPHLLGIGIDVTDPEPLPDGHPLMNHPRALITCHTSGDFEGYFDAATDLLVENIKRIRAGGEPFNKVDPKKGY